MDAVDRIAWREVLRELRELEAEYEKVSRAKGEHCASKNAREKEQPLIELENSAQASRS
jgi:hypothetical protein